MISVLVLGDPFHAARIADTINLRPAEAVARFVPASGYLGELLSPANGTVAIMRVGYRVGARTTLGRGFDAYWAALSRRRPHAIRCHYWIGTDVLHAVEDAAARTAGADGLERSRDDLHLTVAPWLTAELADAGISARTMPLPPSHAAPAVPPPLPAAFSVLTYLPSPRFAFYGGPAVLEAARRLPAVTFDVVGGARPTGTPVPPNVRWHGWVDDMSERYAAATVVVRIPQHDGFGNTVIESLLRARHVVYTQEVPFVRRVPPLDAEALVGVLSELLEDHAAGSLGPNLAGREYALAEFDPPTLAERLVGTLLDRVP